MVTAVRSSPVRFDPSLEEPEPNEAETGRQINESLQYIRDTTSRDYGHAVRAVHAKSHALVTGELQVLDGLPETLRQGLFARPGTYPAVLRFSTNPGDVLPEDISTPRGLAVKVIGVAGERLPGSEGDSTQDFVLVNGPAFIAPSGKVFATNLKLLASTTDRIERTKQALSATLRTTERVLEKVGLESGQAKNLGGQPQTHPLGETYYSQAAFLYGDNIAKFSVAPVSPEVTALVGQTLHIPGRADGVRETLIDHFAGAGGTWELRVQLNTNLETMPIEDTTVVWPEEESPYVAVARIVVKPQPGWSPERSRAFDDGTSFSPWHGIAAHRPLGRINRLRKSAYEQDAAFRGQFNGCPVHEPSALPALTSTAAADGGLGRATNASAPIQKASAATGGGLNRVAAGAVGGLAAGVLTSIMLAAAKKRGEPSDLVQLERRTAVKAGADAPGQDEAPGTGESLFSHSGHLALSAASGAAFGALRSDDGSQVAQGLAFGVGFFALAYGVAGPALGVTPPLWKDKPSSIAQHVGVHALFGVVTALVASSLAKSGTAQEDGTARE